MIASANTGTLLGPKFSTDGGINWTTRTTAPTGGWDSETMTVRANTTGGRVILMGTTTATGSAIRVAYSDNGGVDWTTISNLTTTIATATKVSLEFCEETGYWYFMIRGSSGTAAELWKSINNGATWTKIKTFSAFALQGLAVHSEYLMVAQAEGPTGNVVFQIVYSVDQGVTWHATGTAIGGSLRTCSAGNGRIMAVSSSYAYLGVVATGKPTAIEIT